jgi:hypothetical protein
MTTLYRVWAKFEPEFVNPMTARRGQWRVTGCWCSAHPFKPVINCLREADRAWREIGIHSTKRYPVGSIIRPHKELRRVLAARKAMQ